MKKGMILALLFLISFAVSCGKKTPASPVISQWDAGTLNTASPAATVRMIFIHHSTGSAWIATGNGNLGASLNLNNYWVDESDYGWTASAMATGCGGTDIGNRTDTVNWPCWFTDETMPSVYSNSTHYDYAANTMADPGGDNSVIMFKSCFPNSEVGDDITDEQAVYNSLLPYFSAHTDKMFVLVIPPPMRTISNPSKTRELSNWLADRQNGWLKGYTHKNVYAFDYYNVLTHPDNHHYVVDGRELHVIGSSQNTLYYPSNSGTDDHPSDAGQQKATTEFLPLLNGWYNNWKGI